MLTFPSTGMPISCSYCSYILPRQESRKNPNVYQQEVFSIVMCHPVQVREGNEDDPEVVAKARQMAQQMGLTGAGGMGGMGGGGAEAELARLKAENAMLRAKSEL